MAKILTFRNKGCAPSSQEFLTDENQTLLFHATDDGNISVGGVSQTNLSGLFPDPKKDWSNQELADLFRVRQLLNGANVPVETDRGVTDEGDPWFVFCHANAEVFIHLCRIDGTYFLDSPNLLRPLRGADFNALIADFTNQALPASGDDDQCERRVIRLERGSKVRLHPSAMLAALIWTLFLASEELVLLASEETEEDALLDYEGLAPVDTAATAVLDMLREDETVDLSHLVKEDMIDTYPAAPNTPEQMRDAHQQGLMVHNNAFTMSLSTIAIVMGFMSETVLLNNQRKVLKGLEALDFSDDGNAIHQMVEFDIPADTDGYALIEMLSEFLGQDLSLAIKQQLAEKEETTVLEALQDLTQIEQAAIANIKTTPPVVIHDKGSNTEQPARDVKRAEGEKARFAEEQKDESVPTLTDIVQTWQPKMEEFQLGDTTVKASFDVSDINAFALFEMIDTTANDREKSLREFDSKALELIEFLEAKDGELGFIELENEVIMIDRTAVTGGETGYIQWEAANGQTISFVGLAADFEQFDMVS